MTRLVWFRKDIRTIDNKALFFACQDNNAKIIAIFIATHKEWLQNYMSMYQIDFIYKNLLKLQYALSKLGIYLIYYQCDYFISSISWIKELCQRENIKDLFYNRQYELNEIRKDKILKNVIGDKVIIHCFDDSVLLPPGSVLNIKNEMYKIYTPFRNKFIKKLFQTDISPVPEPKRRGHSIVLNNTIPQYCNKFYSSQVFPPGEDSALEKLENFCNKNITHYIQKRNIPSLDGTSGLSPYLTIGVISPRQCLKKLIIKYQDVFTRKEENAFMWLNEFIWREFYRHLIVAYPFLCEKKPFIDWTDKIKWNRDENMLIAWKNGMTGYPIVDAGMRQLKKKGWINNRLRMITASFLTKNLLIDWREGERYFMTQLLDGDFSSNNGGWQWVSSIGTDAAPYFRIFNPIKQGKIFDPYGIFIRRWLPELNDVPDKYIHTPHMWAKKYNFFLNYPLPIIDHVYAIKKTLYAFKKAKLIN